MKNKPIIAPSILGADQLNLKHDIQQALDNGLTRFHIDIMDGHFVPNLSFGPEIVIALQKAFPQMQMELHLMIANPENFLSRLLATDSTIILLHQESSTNLYHLLQEIQAAGKKAGIVINPGTPVSTLKPYLPWIDQVLVMTVNPGFGGQQFMPEMLQRVQELATLKQKNDYHFDVEVDGGVNDQTISAALAAGANIFVAGSYLFVAGKVNDHVQRLEEIIYEH